MVYLGQYKRWFTLARIKDDLTLASLQDVLPWPVYRMSYFGQYTRLVTLVSIEDGFPWLVYFLGLSWVVHSTRWSTFSRLEDGFTLAIVYRMGYLGQYTRRRTLASTQDGIPWLVYKMDYLG
jgi:hypothetical protein